MKYHDTMCPKTYGRAQCWCDLYQNIWREMYKYHGGNVSRSRVLITHLDWKDYGGSHG